MLTNRLSDLRPRDTRSAVGIRAAGRARAALEEEPLDEPTRIAHLLRRAGFGAGPAELEQYTALGLRDTVEHLLNYTRVEDPAPARVAALNLDLSKINDLQRWWLLRMVYTTRPLQEKMVLFWHGLLTSAQSKVGSPELMRRQNEFFRDHALDSFPAILKGLWSDPAMMIYLDIAGSKRSAPNENFARELMELFTLGVGNYNEGEVRQAARAFTGWTVDRKAGTVRFNRKQFDDGLKPFLGQSGNFDPDGIIGVIVAHPASASYLARRLFTFFAYDDPEPPDLQPLVAAYQANGRSVRAMLQALLTSEAFYSPRAYRALVKSPVEYVVGALRALEAETAGEFLPGLVSRMGQAVFNPPNVAGWPGGPTWLNSATWFERVNFANRLATARRDPQLELPGLDRWFGEEERRDPARAVDAVLALLLDGRAGDEQREILQSYAAGGGRRIPDQRLWGLMHLALAMPEYELA